MSSRPTRWRRWRDMGKLPRSSISGVNFDGICSKNRYKTQWVWWGWRWFDSMRAISLQGKNITSFIAWSKPILLTSAARVLSAWDSSDSGTNKICCIFCPNPPIFLSTRWTFPIGPPWSIWGWHVNIGPSSSLISDSAPPVDQMGQMPWLRCGPLKNPTL